MYPRLANTLQNMSFFLFGARATGKSALLRSKIITDNSIVIDLLDDEQFITFSKSSKILEERLRSHLHRNNQMPDWIVLDEVQRVPKLLNEVHRLLESPEYRGKIKFALTGSSARKLKRRSANMLAGRALVNRLFPLTFEELGPDFLLERVLNWGSLPGVYTADDDHIRAAMLRSYVTTYITEEIREEQVIRNIDPFLRFLEVAAQCNGQIINCSAIGRDCKIEPKTIARYFQILEDTLLGFYLPAYEISVRKQQRQTPKFYLFDLGVLRALSGTLSVPVIPQTYGYGQVFEALIINEIHRLNHYYEAEFKLAYLRTKDGAEVDLVIRTPRRDVYLVEIKSTASVSEESARKLERFVDSFENASAVILSQETAYRRIGRVDVYPWREGVEGLFSVQKECLRRNLRDV